MTKSNKAIVGIAAFIVLAMAIIGPGGYKSRQDAKAKEAAEADRKLGLANALAARKRDAIDNRAQHAQDIKQLIAAKRFEDARQKARSLEQFDSEGFYASLIKEANDAEAPVIAAQRAQLDRDAEKIRNASARAAEKAQTADRAERRKRGVRIGMTADEVLMSSWGRPEHVNRTIRARGSSEQWVYGSGNYLYFENGILTTIQN